MIEDVELLRRCAQFRSEEAFTELVRHRIGGGLVDGYAQQILSESQWFLFKTIDPPDTGGGRFVGEFNKAISKASKAEGKTAGLLW